MCLFWWNTDIYLCGTSKTIASFSTVNWINVPSGCWAGSRAGNCIFCYEAALMVGSILHSSELPSPSPSVPKPFLENPHIKQTKKPTKNKPKQKQNIQTLTPKTWLLFCFVFSTNSPCEPESCNTGSPLSKFELLERLPCIHGKYRSHMEFLPMLRHIFLWDFCSGHLSLQSITQCSILLSDLTQSQVI